MWRTPPRLRVVHEGTTLATAAETERLVALGTYAAGIAHEINNPLAHVILSVTAAMQELGAIAGLTDAQRAALSHAEALLREGLDGVERISKIVDGVRLFSRSESGTIGTVDVRSCVDAVLRLVMHELRAHARLRVDHGEPPLVMGDEVRLGQVFLNLITNAIHAIPEGAPLHHEIHIRTSADADGRAAIEISDTGVGIPPEVAARIFEPFFTTKPPGIGTGLGLSISNDIVRAIGGEIRVESVVGRGTTMRVVLPPASVADAAPRIAVAAPARRAILIIDDDAAIGEALRDELCDDHEIAVVCSAREALDRFQAHERYDLVLCDVRMPGMSGLDLYRTTRSVWPRIARAIVFMTGAALTDEERASLTAEGCTLLRKPFHLDRLEAIMADLAS
jgi:CheY-like chemotaxis protein/two-component sensor histidine kinase